MWAHYSCQCGAKFRVNKMDEHLALLTLRMNCPKDCGGWLEIADEPVPVSGIWEVSAKTLFEMTQGRGSALEKMCSPQRKETMLENSVIRALCLEPSPADPNRSIILNMTVQTTDGSRIVVYFATSTQGATIFKLRKEEDAG